MHRLPVGHPAGAGKEYDMAEKSSDKGAMSVSQAGRKGGQRTAETHGHEFYEEIGRKGGTKVRDVYGHEFYEEIGRKGGTTVRDERGPQFYEEIGHKGGQKVRELIEEGKRRASGGSSKK